MQKLSADVPERLIQLAISSGKTLSTYYPSHRSQDVFRTPKGWLQSEIEWVCHYVFWHTFREQTRYVYDISTYLFLLALIYSPTDGWGSWVLWVEVMSVSPNCGLGKYIQRSLFQERRCLYIACSDHPLAHRLGFITPDNEPDFMKIISQIHGTFDYEKSGWGMRRRLYQFI
jgi:hypothetical protein